jgi:hypothetical protein
MPTAPQACLYTWQDWKWLADRQNGANDPIPEDRDQFFWSSEPNGFAPFAFTPISSSWVGVVFGRRMISRATV